MPDSNPRASLVANFREHHSVQAALALLVLVASAVDDARIPLDNNATERAIRGPVVGRKNHYGSKSRRGTQVAATLCSILETLKLHAIDPAAYLVAAVQAADRGESLLPWQFAASA